MDQKTHWTKVKVSRAPRQELLDALRKLNKKEEDIGKPEAPHVYEGDDRLAELSWFKKGEASRRWPIVVTDDSGNEIKSPDEIDWSNFDELKGVSAELGFMAQVGEAIMNGLKGKP